MHQKRKIINDPGLDLLLPNELIYKLIQHPFHNASIEYANLAWPPLYIQEHNTPVSSLFRCNVSYG